MKNLTEVVAIAGGYNHTLAVRSDGTAWAAGSNGHGQLGDGTAINRTTPVQVSGLTGVIGVAAGTIHSLAVTSDGKVWAWGYDRWGVLGNGSDGDSLTPGPVSGLTGAVAVVAGYDFSLALKSDGTVWAWGRGSDLGNGGSTDQQTPVQVQGLTGVIAITARDHFSLVLKSDGTVWGWGDNAVGEIGDGTTGNFRPTPVQAVGLPSIVSIAAGTQHSLAVVGDGSVWSWGANSEGQLGDGTTISRALPQQIAGLSGFLAVAAGVGHSLALKGDDTVWSWGNNLGGQLGDGTTTSRLTPVQVTGIASVAAIATGWGHSLAIRVDTGTPTLTYTNPRRGAAVQALTGISGTAADEAGGSGVSSVSIRLRRRVDGSALSGKYWNGAAWISSVVNLAVSGTTSWSVTSPLPAGADLPDGVYILYGTVTDNAGNAALVTSPFTVDTVPPASVAFTDPTSGQSVFTLASVTGTAADNAGGSGIGHVLVRLRQLNDTSTPSDDRWWNGSAWVATVANLRTDSTAESGQAAYSTWQVSSPLPGALAGGRYVLYAYAYDRAGSFTTETIGISNP